MGIRYVLMYTFFDIRFDIHIFNINNFLGGAVSASVIVKQGNRVQILFSSVVFNSY